MFPPINRNNNDGNASSKPRKATTWQAVKAVLWAFLGVRKDKDYQLDAVSLSPVQVIVTGIIAAILLVIALLVLVRHITS